MSLKAFFGSDFHLDEMKNPIQDCLIYPDHDTDLIILAGDVGEGFSHIDWLKENSKKHKIIYLPGNHCIYRSSIGTKELKLKEKLQGYDVEVLNQGYIEYNDYVIICATLWTDFSLFPDRLKEAKLDYDLTMADRKKIKTKTFQRLFANNMQKLSFEHKRYIKATLERFKDKKCIVVTHHAPSIQSIPPELHGEIDAACYANNLEDIILENPQIKIWCHGHIHYSSDYYIGGTRVICNPFKAMYYEETWKNPDWNPNLNISLP